MKLQPLEKKIVVYKRETFSYCLNDLWVDKLVRKNVHQAEIMMNHSSRFN